MASVSAMDADLQDNMTTQGQTESSISFVEYQVATLLYQLWPPCILLFGGFGNIATIVVMRRIKDHHSSQYVFLMALAASDFVLLYVGVLRLWVYTLFQVDMRGLSSVTCKLHVWVVYSVNSISAWLVTCVTVQRTMAVLWPHRMRTAWTVRRTWMVVAVVTLAAFLFHLHLVPGLVIIGPYSICDAIPGSDYEYFFRYVFSWLDTAVSSVLPCVCLFVCDVILSMTLFKATSFSASAAAHSVSSTNAKHSNDSRRKTASRTTVMVLALSITFLVLTLPACIVQSWMNFVLEDLLKSQEALAMVSLLTTVTLLLWYTNSAINFLLYCLTGSKFRKEFLKWVCCGAPSASSETGGGE